MTPQRIIGLTARMPFIVGLMICLLVVGIIGVTLHNNTQTNTRILTSPSLTDMGLSEEATTTILEAEKEGNTGDQKKSREESRRSDKERSTDIPSWAKGKAALTGETPKQTAERLMNEHYGVGNWSDRGPNSEYNKIKKFFERR